MRRVLYIAFAISFVGTTTSAFAQLSTRDYAAMAATQRSIVDAQNAWRTSKKIVVDKVNIPESPKGQLESTCVRELQNDSVCYLEYWQFRVLQIIGPKDMLIGIDNPSIPPLWVTGVPTADFVDDDPVRVVGLVEVAGTKDYTTVAGANKTVRSIRLVSAERQKTIEDHMRIVVAERQKQFEEEKREQEEEKLYRVWTTAKSDYSTEAMFVAFKAGKVVIKKRDGSEITIDPSVLSRKDQTYYRNLLRERNSMKTVVRP